MRKTCFYWKLEIGNWFSFEIAPLTRGVFRVND